MRASIAWPLFILAIALTSLTGAAMLVYASHSDPSFAVEPDYYAKAAHWDEAARQAQQNKRLGWTITALASPPDHVRIRVSDHAGKPIIGAAVSAVAFASVRASERFDLQFSGEGDGIYRAPLNRERGGLWCFRFTVGHGGSNYTSAQDLAMSTPTSTEAPP